MTTPVLHQDLVFFDVAAHNKMDALSNMTSLLAQKGVITDRHAFLNDVLEREGQGATGIGDGIAIPHGKSNAVQSDAIAIGVLQEPVTWESIDDAPVDIVILFAVDARAAKAYNTHLEMMAVVASALASDSVRANLHAAQNSLEIIQALQGASASEGSLS